MHTRINKVSNEAKVNMQMWVDKEFFDHFKEISKENGFINWQTFAGVLFQSIIDGHFEIYPPKIKVKQKLQK